MKKILLTITLIVTTISLFGQKSSEFRQTNDYYITKVDSIVADNYWKNNTIKTESILVYLKNNKGKTLTKYEISELEFYRGATIEILDLEKMKNLKQVLHVKLSYDTCCSNHYSSYFLLTNNGELIELAEIENLHCDGPEPKFEYRFPNQKFGKKDKILMTKSTLNNDYKVESVEIIKTYFWNGEKIRLEK